ncbi:MAG: hypothetical protein HFJ28_01025 [Clostridia bacterium]|jgi:hypothetical protein|nr:hypothetical protein [Clostridia bacterium]
MMKKACRIIIIFMLAMGASILPTVLLKTKDEMNILFQQPKYWIITLFIAAIVTWQIVKATNDSKM